MKLFGAKAMKEMDNYAINTAGIPSLKLMETASGHIVEAVLSRLGGGSVAVFCGSGNNGGDGVCAAAMLAERGVRVRAFLTGSREKMTPDTAEMEKRLVSAGGLLEPFGADGMEDYVNSCSVLVDAMFGTGLNSPLRGQAAQAAELMSSAPGYVVAADVPSGTDADSGLVYDGAVRADETVTFSFAKPGLCVTPGCIRAGKVTVRDIGIPDSVKAMFEPDAYTVEAGDISLPHREMDSRKSTFGKDLIIGGSIGYTGATYMAAAAASKTGAGLVTLCVPESVYAIVAPRCTEVMALPLPGDDKGNLSSAAIPAILSRAQAASAVLFGPGAGVTADTVSVTEALLSDCRVPLVLDADGINAAALNIKITDTLKSARCPVILTPHEGEFKRLGGDLSRGRIAAARDFSVEYGCVTVLKGCRTVTAMPDGSVFVNTTGGPALAKGGSGDVLAGMIVSLLGQGFPVKDAVLAAVYLHGRAGDICAERLSDYSVTAGDVISAIPEAIMECLER